MGFRITITDEAEAQFGLTIFREADLPDASDFAVLLGFTPAWHSLGVVHRAFLDRAKADWDRGEDRHIEHYRYRAFVEFVAIHRPLSPELAAALYELGAADLDPVMGGAMMRDIVSSPECPEVILSHAMTSGRPHLPRIVERRRSSGSLPAHS
jgi:hypothetical protein